MKVLRMPAEFSCTCRFKESDTFDTVPPRRDEICFYHSIGSRIMGIH